MYSRLIYCTLSIGIKAPSIVVGGSLVNIDSMLKFCFASVTHVLGSQQSEREGDLAFEKPSTLLVLNRQYNIVITDAISQTL